MKQETRLELKINWRESEEKKLKRKNLMKG